MYLVTSAALSSLYEEDNLCVLQYSLKPSCGYGQTDLASSMEVGPLLAPLFSLPRWKCLKTRCRIVMQIINMYVVPSFERTRNTFAAPAGVVQGRVLPTTSDSTAVTFSNPPMLFLPCFDSQFKLDILLFGHHITRCGGGKIYKIDHTT